MEDLALDPMKMIRHFDHIHDLELDIIKTIYLNPEYILDFEVYHNIFANDVHKQMFIVINQLFEENIEITPSTIFNEIIKVNPLITYKILSDFIDKGNLISSNNLKQTIVNAKKNKVRISLFKLASGLTKNSINNSLNVENLFVDLENELEKLKVVFDVEGESINNILDGLISYVDDIKEGKILSYLKTGCKEIDKKLAISGNSIILVGGGAKNGKTKFASWLVRLLFENNINQIACQWYTMEDDKEDLSASFISPYSLLRVSEIKGKERNLTNEDRDNIIRAAKIVKRYGIDVHDEPVNIKTIQHKFGIFAKKNKGKTPICVIDNALLLEDEGHDRDDVIMNTISKIRQKTKGLIIVIHHFNDGQMDKERLKVGYRPLINDLKGREGYRRVPNQVILVNKPSKYKDLMTYYKPYADILEYMYIVDIAANRGMKELETENQGSEAENNLIYMYASLDYNIFKPLSEIY